VTSLPNYSWSYSYSYSFQSSRHRDHVSRAYNVLLFLSVNQYRCCLFKLRVYLFIPIRRLTLAIISGQRRRPSNAQQFRGVKYVDWAAAAGGGGADRNDCLDHPWTPTPPTHRRTLSHRPRLYWRSAVDQCRHSGFTRTRNLPQEKPIDMSENRFLLRNTETIIISWAEVVMP